MAEEVQDNDNLEPAAEGVSKDPPAVFNAAQTPVNLAKKTANKLDWMMPDYADEDARGEGKAIAGLAEQLESAAQTVSMQDGESQSVAPASMTVSMGEQIVASAPQASPVTFAEEFQHELQSAPAQAPEPESVPVLAPEPALVPEPLYVDQAQHQSIDEFKAAPSSIHFLKPPEAPPAPAPIAPERLEESTQFVPLPDLPRSLDTLKLNEAAPIAPAPTRPVYSKKSDSSEKLVPPDRLQGAPAPLSDATSAVAQSHTAPGSDAPAHGQPGYAPPAPHFAPPPATPSVSSGLSSLSSPVDASDYQSQIAQSESASLRQALQSGSGPVPPVPVPNAASQSASQSASPPTSPQASQPESQFDAESSSKPAAKPVRKSRLPRSIAAPEDDEIEEEPVPHGRSFKKLPPSRSSAAPLPIERGLQSPTSRVAVIIAVSVLIGVGVGVGFLANIKKPDDTATGAPVKMPAGGASTPRTIDAATLLGTKPSDSAIVQQVGSSGFAPVETRDLKTIDQARDAGARQLLAGNYEGARKCYTAALVFDAHDMTSLHKRGLSNYLLGSYPAALIDLDKVLERDHRYVPALLDRAATYYKMGEYKKAQADYDLLFAVDRGNRFALLGLSLCKSKQNLSEDALKTLSRLTFGDPGYVGGYEAAGYEFIKTGDYQRAAVAFSKALNVAPNDARIYALRARSYLLAGDKAHAIDDYNKAIAMSKDGASTANYKHDLAVAQGVN